MRSPVPAHRLQSSHPGQSSGGTGADRSLPGPITCRSLIGCRQGLRRGGAQKLPRYHRNRRAFDVAFARRPMVVPLSSAVFSLALDDPFGPSWGGHNGLRRFAAGHYEFQAAITLCRMLARRRRSTPTWWRWQQAGLPGPRTATWSEFDERVRSYSARSPVDRRTAGLTPTSSRGRFRTEGIRRCLPDSGTLTVD